MYPDPDPRPHNQSDAHPQCDSASVNCWYGLRIHNTIVLILVFRFTSLLYPDSILFAKFLWYEIILRVSNLLTIGTDSVVEPELEP